MRPTLACLAVCMIPLWGTSTAFGQPLVDGTLRTYQGFRTDPADRWLVNRSNLDLILTFPGRVRTHADASFEYDAVGGQARVRIRDLYGDIRNGMVDLRIGRFSHSFGRADGLLLGDLFHTYDLSEFLTRDPEDLRTGIDGLRIGAFAGPHALKLIVSPFRSRSRGPKGDWSMVPERVSFIPVIDASQPERPLALGPLNAALQQQGWHLTHIFNTHHHFDHAGGNLALKDQWHCTIVGSRTDAERIPGIDVTVGDGDSR